MNNKRNQILAAGGAIIFLTLSIFVILFISNGPYREKIPALPDFKSVPKPIQDQLTDATRQAWLFPTSGSIGNLGMAYYSCANIEKAAQCFELAIQKNNSKWIWSYYLGVLNLERGESKAAIADFKRVLALESTNLMAILHMGEAFQNLGLTDDAEKLFVEIGDHAEISITDRDQYFPLKTYAKFRVARIYLDSKRTDIAETTLKEIIADQITFGPAYRLLGNVYSVKGDSVLAKKYTVRANDLAAYLPPADNLIDKIVLQSRSDQYLLKQIDDAIRSNNFHWALVLSNHALKYYPENKYLLSRKIVQDFRLGNSKEALSYLDRHFSYFSSEGAELMDFTDMLYDKGLFRESMKYFEQVKKLMPQNSELALWLFDSNKKEEATNLLNEQLKKDPKNIKILADVSRMLLNLGDNDLVNKYMENIRLLSPGSIELSKLAGEIAERQGKPKEAIANYEAVIKADPKDLITIENLSGLYIGEKMWLEAITLFKSSLEFLPNEPILLEEFGRLLIACPDPGLKDVNLGREFSERAFINFRSTIKTKLSAGRTLATAYALLGDKKNASKFMHETLNLASGRKGQPELIAYFNSMRKLYKIPE